MRGRRLAAIVVLAAGLAAAGRAGGAALGFTFAVPEVPSRISLGVFDGGGRLVRILTRAAAEEEFGKDLNGFRTEWDGRDDSGNPCAPGTYRVKGWAVPETVTVEGDSFPFNDWTGPDGIPPVSRPLRVFAGGGGVLLAGLNGQGQLAIWESPKATAELGPAFFLPEGGRLLCGDTSRVAVWTDGEAVVFQKNPDGKWEPGIKVPAEGSAIAALSDSDLAIVPVGGSEAVLYPVGGGGALKLPALPAPPVSLALRGDSLFATDGASLWMAGRDGIQSLPVGDATALAGLGIGPDATLWFSADTAGGPVVRQIDTTGAVLRELKTTARPLDLAPDPASLRIFLIEQSGSALRTTGLQPAPDATPEATPAASPEAQTVAADWEVFLDATCDPAAARQLAGTLPGGATIKPQIEIPLDPNPLEPGPSKLALRASATSGALWIEDADGLPLVAVAGAAAGEPAALAAVPGAILAIIGRHYFAEAYLVRGLNQSAAIDAGEIEWRP